VVRDKRDSRAPNKIPVSFFTEAEYLIIYMHSIDPFELACGTGHCVNKHNKPVIAEQGQDI
jgi:hypothetical protein